MGDVMSAIKALIEGVKPKKTVYLNNLPRGFTRPSFLLEQISRSETDLCKSLRNVRIDYAVTIFTTVDEYNIADQSALIAAQNGVMALFANGYITVGDRAPHVVATNGGLNPGEAYVDVTVEYTESARTDTTAYEKMGGVGLKTELREA